MSVIPYTRASRPLQRISKKSIAFTRRSFAPPTTNSTSSNSPNSMFAAARIPAYRTSSQYVCYACRSQRLASSQPWRALSTDSQTTPQAPDNPPPPPNPESTVSSSVFGAEIHTPTNEAPVQGEKVQDVQSLGSVIMGPKGVTRKQKRRKKIEEIKELQKQLLSTGDGEVKSENTALDQETASTEDSELQPVEEAALTAAAQRKKALRKKNLPDPSYTTTHDNGEVRAWQAEVAFDGEKFKVEAHSKRSARAKIQKLIMKHISSMPPPKTDIPAKTAAGDKNASDQRTSLDKRTARARATALKTRSVTSKSGLRRVLAKNTPQGLTLREALTGQRRPTNAAGAKVRGAAKGATDLSLPPNIRSGFKPAEKVEILNASSLEVKPLHVPQSPVPPLSYGLDRVLFNPGVYRLRDPRSRVYNFDPYLEKVVPAEEFDFAALKGYKVASTDPTLSNIAAENGLKYFTSTSSLTSVLMTFHFLISQWRPIDISMLSKTFDGPNQTNFTTFTRAPTSVILKPKNGGYAIDKDDDGFGNPVLSLVGRSLEKLLTVPKKEFERYRRSKVTGKSAVESPDTEEAFHYTGIGNLLVRSQLDGHDPRLPGTGIFDIKTRAVLPVRMDGKGKMEVASSYEIKNDHGNFESFEREYHDMLRAPMLKYSMQARLGRMDGIFVAYHNISRMFGFQYVSLPEIDRAIHGSTDTFRGDQELRASINILQDVLDRASTKFPDQPLRMVFETRPGDVPYMYIFVEPVTFEYLEERAIEKQRRVDELEKAVTFPNGDLTAEFLQTAVIEPGIDENVQVQKEIEINDGEIADSSDALAKILQEQQAPVKPEPKSAVQRLIELLSGQSADQAKETDKAAQLSQAQASAVNIIREASKFREADLIDARRSTRKGELGKLKAVATKLDKWLDDIESDLVPGVQDTDHDAQIARLRDVTKRTLEECKSFRQSHYDASGSILALALTVRNKVNGQYVSGPPDVNRKDEWDIEYSIHEMEDHSKAWAKYDACVARRDNATAFGKDDAEADEKWYGGRFMQELAEWSRRGAAWRLKQDEIDRTMVKEVFEPIDKSVVELDEVGGEEAVKEEAVKEEAVKEEAVKEEAVKEEAVKEEAVKEEAVRKEEGKGVVEGYMTWLFSGKGGDGKKE
ncbi:hypothetical protein EG328_006218 [Venturia inaequalis]|uniref:Pet127-domain-containing protein n=1 Tax=Venturia inaequalis TaxID=5025 RepID=A0A8H3Z513_VENIN|nr:hypothetical protein EG328_006218 [Venturia inaequalis]